MKDLFYFSRGERNALLVLLSLIAIAWMALLVTDEEEKQPEGPTPALVRTEKQPAAATDTLTSPKRATVAVSAAAQPHTATQPANTQRSWPRIPQQTPRHTRSEKVAPGTLIELNSADTTRLKQVPGIGSTFARRIVNYRDLLGGYYTVEQLAEVYGIDEERYNALAPWFRVDTSAIQPLLLNQHTYKELLRHPYLNNTQVRQIDRMRRQKPLRDWTDLSLLEEFSEVDRQRLRPYVSFQTAP